jgi:hypothetical protein
MSWDDREQRIREHAYRIWERDGRPDGRADAHWEEARLYVAVEDGHGTMFAHAGPQAEPIEALSNQGEFPTLNDQGEQHIPAHPKPGE